MIVSAIYVLSPVDIIPEGTNGCKLPSIYFLIMVMLVQLFPSFPMTALLGIIGLLDDFIIVLICFLHVAALYRSVLVLRHGGF